MYIKYLVEDQFFLKLVLISGEYAISGKYTIFGLYLQFLAID